MANTDKIGMKMGSPNAEGIIIRTKGSAKVWWIVIVLIVIIGGVWWWNSQSSTAVAPAADQGLSTSPSDSSNGALDQDMTSVDSQMSGLGSDNTAVDQSLTASSTQ